MKRYFISPVIGEGTNPTTDAFRAAVGDANGTKVTAIIPTVTNQQDPNYGKPKYNFCFCRAATQDLTAALQVSNSFCFPDYPLDGRMDGMNSEVRTGMVQSLEAYDLDGNGLELDATHQDSDSYGSFLTSIAQQLESASDLNKLDLSEPNS